MPWCGYWGAPFGGFWWLMPLFGFLFMAVMIGLCLFRGFGRGPWRSRFPGRTWHARDADPDVSELKREVASLRDELRKLRQPT